MSETLSPMDDEDMGNVTLILEDGGTMECEVVTALTIEDKEYVALLPLTGEETDDEEDTVYLYRYLEEEGKDPEIRNIEDDDEFDVVAEAFEAWMDESYTEEWDLDDVESDDLE